MENEDPLAAFVGSIARTELLEPAALKQLREWAATPGIDPQEIAREIVQRKWLTAFQVKQFWKGRGQALFISQYVLMDKIGEGLMGNVYKARHVKMDREVALKLIRQERLANPGAVERFRREIQAASQLQHENVVVAYDASQAGENQFFVMEYVEGENLKEIIRREGKLTPERACDMIRQAALGLQHAFERGMIHRDIKPANIMVGKKGIVKITDFGLARLEQTNNEETRLTYEGQVFGTPDYISPEQGIDARNTDIRSDIYSLGATFYHMLAGHTMYPEGSPLDKMIAHRTLPIPKIERDDLPPELLAVLEKMLAKRPEDRYQTPSEVADALKTFVPQTLPILSGLLPRPTAVSATAAGNAPETHESDTESRFRFTAAPKTENVVPVRSNRTAIVVLSSLIFLALVVLVVLLFLPQKPIGKDPVPAKLSSPIGLQFVLIPAGKFQMGSLDTEEGRQANEGPRHEVEIAKPFYIATTETTQKVYEKILGENPSQSRNLIAARDLPVESVTWKDAERFCQKLNQRPDAETGKPAGWTFRLPTEAEWEYACRAGRGERFHFGDNIAETQAALGKRRTPVKAGSLEASSLGLFDMHGNVWEWTQTLYAPQYDPKDKVDPKGPAEGNEYVIRGGAYDEAPEDCRSARRRGLDPNAKEKNVGFRIAIAKD